LDDVAKAVVAANKNILTNGGTSIPEPLPVQRLIMTTQIFNPPSYQNLIADVPCQVELA